MYSVAIIENDERAAAELVRMIEASSLASRLTFAGMRHVTSTASGASSAAADARGSEASVRVESGSIPGGGSASDAAPLRVTDLPDILFVDVKLDHGANGIELIHRLIPAAAPVQVIYVSAYLEYAPAAYHTRHTWFLSKPVDPAELDAALTRAVAALDAERSEPLLVHQGSALVRIAPHQVRYVESDRRKVRIHERDRVIETYARISDLEARLPKQFARCHKSFLVNLAFVSELHGRELILASGERLPVSQRCRKSLADRLVAFIGRSL